MRISSWLVIATLVISVAANSGPQASDRFDTVDNAVGRTLRIQEATGDTVLLYLEANHRFNQRLIDPDNKAPWVMSGNKVCERTPQGPRECHATTGRWWVQGTQLCQQPDDSERNYHECHELTPGKKVGDTWSQPDGFGGQMTVSILAKD